MTDVQDQGEGGESKVWGGRSSGGSKAGAQGGSGRRRSGRCRCRLVSSGSRKNECRLTVMKVIVGSIL